MRTINKVKLPLDLVEDFIRIKTQKEQIDKEHKKLSERIKELMGENEESIAGNWKVTLNHVPQRRIDTDLVREKDPKLAEECTVEIMTRPLHVKPWIVTKL